MRVFFKNQSGCQLGQVGKLCIIFFTMFSLAQRVSKQTGQGAHFKPLGNSKYRPLKIRLVASAVSAIYHGTHLEVFVVLLFGHVLRQLRFHVFSFLLMVIFRQKRNRISKFELERFLRELENSLGRTQEMLIPTCKSTPSDSPDNF